MSSEFVRYASEIETIDPHIDELLAQIVDFAEKRPVNRRGPRTRGGPAAPRTGSHSGLVKSDVEILAEVPAA